MKIVRATVCALCLGTAACGGSSAPTSPTPVITTDTFTGSLAPTTSTYFPFNVAQMGVVTVTLVSAGPPSTISIGVGIGTFSGTTCSLVSGATVAASTTPALSGSVAVGSYCLLVADVGNLSASIDFNATVAHP